MFSLKSSSTSTYLLKHLLLYVVFLKAGCMLKCILFFLIFKGFIFCQTKKYLNKILK